MKKQNYEEIKKIQSILNKKQDELEKITSNYNIMKIENEKLLHNNKNQLITIKEDSNKIYQLNYQVSSSKNIIDELR
jgi:hypothetical protein